MKNLLAIVVTVGMIVLLAPAMGTAQYYGYYSPYVSVPYPQQAPAATAGAASPKKPLYYRMGPDPLLYWKWNRYNVFQSYQKYLRSPNNPESDLSYMLRTF